MPRLYKTFDAIPELLFIIENEFTSKVKLAFYIKNSYLTCLIAGTGGSYSSNITKTSNNTLKWYKDNYVDAQMNTKSSKYCYIAFF